MIEKRIFNLLLAPGLRGVICPRTMSLRTCTSSNHAAQPSHDIGFTAAFNLQCSTAAKLSGNFFGCPAFSQALCYFEPGFVPSFFSQACAVFSQTCASNLQPGIGSGNASVLPLALPVATITVLPRPSCVRSFTAFALATAPYMLPGSTTREL